MPFVEQAGTVLERNRLNSMLVLEATKLEPALSIVHLKNALRNSLAFFVYDRHLNRAFNYYVDNHWLKSAEKQNSPSKNELSVLANP